MRMPQFISAAAFISKALLVAGVMVWGCVERFDAGSINYMDQLVVDGIITNEFKQHQVIISHSTPLNDQKFTPEQGARVSVTDNGGLNVVLSETSPGVYVTPLFAGTIGNKYTLHFQTATGKSYISGQVEMKPVPPIDRIYGVYPVGQNGEEGVQLYLNSGDGRKRTNYYHWEYEETYEIQTPFPSKFVWLGGNEITLRLQQVNNCWATKSSDAIFIGKTAGLSEDRVVGFPIRFLPSISQELVIKYSINVRQYALSEESYIYWQKLKEINEKQGTLYDKQPGNLRGNISSLTNDSEYVSGFFDASAVSTKRVFFTPKDFQSAGFEPAEYLKSCTESAPIVVPIEKLSSVMEPNQGSFIIYDATGPGPNTILLLRKACCDCTAQGTNIRPSFWQ